MKSNDGSFLHGASATIVTFIEPQTGRKEDQISVFVMQRTIFDGCINALIQLGPLACFIKEIVITFPKTNGEAYVWPTVLLVFHAPNNMMEWTVFSRHNQKFEAFSDFRILFSDDYVKERISAVAHREIYRHQQFLKEIGERMSPRKSD